jgi:hypothetical protein
LNIPYTVAPPFSAVAADNMNIFYAGIENPVSVSGCWFFSCRFKSYSNGCGAVATPSTAGKYVITVKSAGTCSVTVAAKVNGVYQQQGPVKTFRVKDIPPPYLKIGGKLATSNHRAYKNE